ncbi:MAG: hypothetical protein ACPG49_08255 [Chitinophagales bacterium]
MQLFKVTLFVVSLFFIALSPSCKKDDASPNNQNQFTLNEESFEISKGFIEEYGSNGNDSYDFDVSLVSSDINYNQTEGDFSGTGNVIYLDLNTSSENGLVSGTYNYSDDRDTFTLVAAAVATNYDTENETGSNFAVTGGSVDVDVDGSNVSFEFNLTISNNATVTGSFKGSLLSID